MVLENASASTSSDSFADSAPTSDADPYSDSQPGGSMEYHIDTSKFPKPIPIIGRLLGYNEALYSKSLQARIHYMSELLGRPPTQEEATAVAYYTAKNMSIYSYGAPVGVAAGCWRAYNSRSTFQFPFYRPNPETFTPDRFPPGIGAITGIRAMACWHAARASSYAALGMLFSQLIFASYGATTAAVGELTDTRLKAVAAAIQARAQKQRGALPGMQGTTKVPNRGPQVGTQHDSSDGSSQDDASPTGGMFEEENTQEAPGSFGGNVSGSTQKGGQWPSRPAPLPAQQRSEEPDAQPFDAWDDASPTGGQVITPSSTPESQGSAWDRVRRGDRGASGPSNSSRKTQSNQSPWARQQSDTQKEQIEGSTTGDSFAFSKTEEERTYAKDEAQKEFDARVERERRGGDFGKGNGDQRRW